jgi:GNAT superfamily N-acetyltransferase
MTSRDAADDDVVITPSDPYSAEVDRLLTSYMAEIHATFGHDPTRDVPPEPADFMPPRGLFLVVRHGDGRAAGCCAVRLLDPDTAEVKRMWLDPSMRGRGAGRRLLEAIESAAVSLGARRAVLDTNASLTTAIALYRSAGWVDVPAYNDNPEATNWFAKDLTG